MDKEEYENLLDVSTVRGLSPRLEIMLRKQTLLREKLKHGSCEDCFKPISIDRHYSFHFYYKNIDERDRDPLTICRYVAEYTIVSLIEEIEKCKLYCSSCYFTKLIEAHGEDKLWKVISICERMSKQSCF